MDKKEWTKIQKQIDKVDRKADKVDLALEELKAAETVGLLNEIIKSGQESREEILEEIKNDLEGG